LNKYKLYYDQTIGICTQCDPKGFIQRGRTYVTCDCHLQYTQFKKLHDSGLPKSYWNKSIADFNGDKKALSAIQDYTKKIQGNLNKGIGLYLYGSPGVGKTLLSSYVLQETLKRNKNAHFYFFTDILNVFTEAWHDDEARNEVENNIINSDLLIMDDVGKEFKSNKKLHESILDTVVRNRASQLRPIIITSNYDILDVKETYGHGIVDLFKESLVVIPVKGDSYRKIEMEDKQR
jgi:DNA replication protein DnaC